MAERIPPALPAPGSLVLYKGHAARVRHIGDKLEIELPGDEVLKVRPKDVTLLHPGPLLRLADLRPQTGEVETAWEMLAGQTTTLAELAELAYGAFTPATAWAAWQLAADGLYFRWQGAEEAILASTAEEVQRTRAARAAEAAEKEAWGAFLARVREGSVLDPGHGIAAQDARYLREVEALALGRSARSRVLRELGREETPENAHAVLLELGYWTPANNPYPQRQGLSISPPDLLLPDLPDEPRRDLTHLAAFAIDDAATDIPDDALSYDAAPSDRLGPGLAESGSGRAGGRLWVHVADPAALAPPASPADLEARARGATLYLPEVTAPMLPTSATPRLGLGLADVSAALSFHLELDGEGAVSLLEVVPSWVHVTRLTYEEAAGRLEQEPLRSLYRLALAYQAYRVDAGAISIELPEVDVRVRDGIVSIHPLPRLPSRALVENAMIMTGEAVARYAVERQIPVPFATQDPPDAAPADLSQSQAGGGLAAAYALRRTMKRSQYRSVPAPHAGLGLPAYVQVTSPMRRYLDLVAHQQLRAHVRGQPLLSADEILERVGATEAVIGAVRQAEQLSNQHWTLVFLLQHPGWRGEGVVVDRRNLSATVLIPELGLEPRVHLSADLPLDSAVALTLKGVDLPRLDARFRGTA